MEDEVVRRRRWLSRARFLDLLGAVNLVPGPNSTELAIHIGLLAGWAGFLVAGVCFILPAATLTGLIAWAYVRFGALPQAQGILYGIKPVVVAVVVQALWKLGREALKTRLLVGVGLLALGLKVLGADELLVLLAAGAATAGWRLARDRRPGGAAPLAGCLGVPVAAAPQGVAGMTAAGAVGLGPLFLSFLKLGSVLFGSGYVLLAFLRADLVERRGWLSEAELLDAVAVGQVTPGPVFTTATF